MKAYEISPWFIGISLLDIGFTKLSPPMKVFCPFLSVTRFDGTWRDFLLLLFFYSSSLLECLLETPPLSIDWGIDLLCFLFDFTFTFWIWSSSLFSSTIEVIESWIFSLISSKLTSYFLVVLCLTDSNSISLTFKGDP